MDIKKGSKIRYNGYEDGKRHSYLTVGKAYEVIYIGEITSEYAVILDDRGETYVWRYPLEGQAKLFNLVTDPLPMPLATVHVKVGDKIRFNGARGYTATTAGEEYEVTYVTEDGVRYIRDDGYKYTWNFRKFPTHFTVVSSSKPSQAPVVHEGDIIEFLGSEECRNRYRDTTVGERYKVHDVTYSDSGEVESVYYLDNASDNVNWNVRFAREWGHFKVHASGQGAKGIYKDDVIHTRPTKLDLESIMDLALDLEDIAWAQDIYNQIQQLEGEHA